MAQQITARPNLVGATYNQQAFFTELYAMEAKRDA